MASEKDPDLSSSGEPRFLTSDQVVLSSKTMCTGKPSSDHDSIEPTSALIKTTSFIPKQLQHIPRPPLAEPLEENDYVSALDSIIKRDFFPDLEKLQAQNQMLDEYMTGPSLNRVSLNQPIPFAQDTPALHSSTSFETPMFGHSSAAFTPLPSRLDTPNPHLRLSDNMISPDKKYDTNLSLDTFQSKYTSEDNASFAQILESQNQEKKERYAWLYEPERKQQLQLTEQSDRESQKQFEEKTRRAIAAGPTNDPKRIETWSYTAKNAVMYGPEGAPLTFADVECNSRGQPKAISHSATRFSSDPFANALRDGSSDASSSIIHLDKKDGTNYNYVPMTPLLAPSQDVNPSELMTWGSIEGTPMLVDSGRIDSNKSFRIPDTPRRESIAHKLSEKASKALRKRTDASPSLSLLGSKKAGTPLRSPAMTPSLQRGLSPAAQKLLASKSSRLGSSLRIPGVDSQLRASYSSKNSRVGTGSTIISRSGMTPTPSRLNTSSSHISSSQSTTLKKENPPSEEINQSTSITDNLLDL